MHECADKPAGTLGQSTHRDHLTLNESPRITATVGGCAPGLAQLIAAARPGSRTRDSTGHASTAPRLRAGRRRTWRRIPTLPGHGRRSSVALRKKHATARSRGAASGSCATPGESKAYRDFRRAGRTLLPTARPLRPRAGAGPVTALPAVAAVTSPPPPKPTPRAIIPDATRPTVRPEDFLPYFQIPGSARSANEVNVIMPANSVTSPAPATLPPSTATFTPLEQLDESLSAPSRPLRRTIPRPALNSKTPAPASCKFSSSTKKTSSSSFGAASPAPARRRPPRPPPPFRCSRKSPPAARELQTHVKAGTLQPQPQKRLLPVTGRIAGFPSS